MALLNKSVINIDEISTSTETQIRVTMNIDQIEHYAERMQEGDTFPPVLIFKVGNEYILADGFHRIAAAKQLGLKKISCSVEGDGDAIDIVRAAIHGNTIHGLPMTKQDRLKAINLFDRIAKGRFGKYATTREVAELVGCSHTTVANIRKDREHIPQGDFGDSGLESFAKKNASDDPETQEIGDNEQIERSNATVGNGIAIGREYAKACKNLVRVFRKTVREFADEPSGVMITGHTNVLNRLLDDIGAIVAGCEPVDECDLCKGAGCHSCKQSGLLFAEQAKSLQRDEEAIGGA